MPEEERRISPTETAIVGGVVVFGTLITLAILVSTRAGPPVLPPGLANLYGVVTDTATGLPINEVKVTINGLTTTTNANGEYAFEGLAPGSYVIEFSKAGYHTLTR